MAASDGDAVTGRDGDEQTSGDESATGGLSAADRAWVRRTVAELGALTSDEREYLAYMFHRRV
ncbi:hypothetical protein E1287_23145 [Actinomadura sp. KC06]|nr:hypothetical protein E1287_23145 [Actinomadura sp. KC06]